MQQSLKIELYKQSGNSDDITQGARVKRFCNEWTAECLQRITNGLRCGSFRAIKIALGYRTGDNPVRKKQTRNELQVHTYAYVPGL